MTTKILNQQQLKAVCDVLADINRGLTKTEPSRLLQQCQIELIVAISTSSCFWMYIFLGIFVGLASGAHKRT